MGPVAQPVHPGSIGEAPLPRAAEGLTDGRAFTRSCRV